MAVFMEWEKQGTKPDFCLNVVCDTSAHISLARAGHMMEPNRQGCVHGLRGSFKAYVNGEEKENQQWGIM